MLAVTGALPGDGDWAYEMKWDGVRAIAVVEGGQVRLYARSGAEVTAAYPELAGLADAVDPDTVLDGEIVVLDAAGRPSFAALAERMHVRDRSRAAQLAGSAPVTYMIFDLLRLAGESHLAEPYHRRRQLLEELAGRLPASRHWLVPPSFDDGPATLAAATEHSLEGVVAKRRDSPYRPGERSTEWLKIKRDETGDFVIGGWRPGARRLGALLVGSPAAGGGLVYRGRVGGGISAAAERALLTALAPLRTDTSPFAEPLTRDDARDATWVRPELVVEVRYGQQTPDGRLRFPRFVRLRPDKPSTQAGPPVPPALAPVSQLDRPTLVTIEGRTLELSNLDKVLYPASGYTKGEVIDYYARVAPMLLPHLRDRALTRIRYPNGVTEASFFEKNAPAGTPSWVRTETLPVPGSSTGRETLDYVVADDLATVIWLANLAALELHTHQWRIGAVGPDLLVLDLDPGPPAGLTECADVALVLRDRLARDGLAAVAKTSGKKGMQLYCPISASQPAAVVSGYAKRVAEELARAQPRKITAQMAKRLRPGKVFIDWSQNAAAKTTVAPYSLRAEPSPTVSTPVTWDEVAGVELGRYSPEQLLARLASYGDLLAPLLDPGPPVPE
ncbi:DNA ligase D [Natronosporangium hydrolyticum]|uniref:DNA ligase (ATP) n=1 Tax=Natronosporangium hydrolyticum TaxID=2811111 RepID=A0A895YGW2_9ACTN|nr:DNA ligase D [Natronosporangium hydrolyticum]QSB15295.1 DNA ligase D [Natronosporangium hydrolyticum]